MTLAATRRGLWIFSARVDLLVFGLPALVAAALILATPLGRNTATSPEWLWITGVLLVDVAHVWSTSFITYLSPAELRRHPERYWLVPGAGWMLGVLLYALGGATLFWRCLAYVAVFHFVRQQYGWMALYRARAGDRDRWGGIIDGAAIYAATLYPLLWWHAHLPRHFAWFIPGDFVSGVPPALATLAVGLYASCLVAYTLRALAQAWRREPIAWGKHLLLLGTAATWYLGIVARDADAAFTVANVFVHGIPYAVLVFSYGRFTSAAEKGPAARLLRGSGWVAFLRFLSCLWLLAYLEELLWDRGVWHERSDWFGAPVDLSALEPWLVPLLAVPQLTHYVLDGLFWRRAQNPHLRQWFARGGGSPANGQASAAEAREAAPLARG